MLPETSDIVYDEERIFARINAFPQTYETILGRAWCNSTEQVLVRKRLKSLTDDGRVLRMLIPGTRGGKQLFFVHPKKYHVIVEASRLGVSVYTFFDYVRQGNKKLYIKVDKCWQLDGTKWKELGCTTFFEGDILKVI